MKFLSKLKDLRVNALNVLIEMKASEYLPIASKILDNNEYQRKRVKKSGSVYSLLREDLISGCLMPPIVLATTKSSDLNNINQDSFEKEIFFDTNKLFILDGLQRTHLLIEIGEADATVLERIILRVEIYVNINEVGILYRMLTLNTGQTPMTLKHQIEILYSHYLDGNIANIKIIRQKDDDSKKLIDEYYFSDLIEGYNSYIERNELPLDKFSLLDTVKSLENIKKDNIQKNNFENFVKVYHKLVLRIQEISSDWQFPSANENIAEEYALESIPFGNQPYKILNKAQSLSGFGAAIGKLIDQKSLGDFEKLAKLIDSLQLGDQNVFFIILKRLDEIRNDAKKIGNAQRLFFHHLFRGLFDESNKEDFLNFAAAVNYGYQMYKKQLG